MPAADTKDALVAVSVKEFDKLQTLLTSVANAEALAKDSEDTSIRDVLVHRAYWIDLFLGWSADSRAGRTVHMPAEGYGWGDLKDLNARIRAENADIDWEAAKTALAVSHDRLMKHLNGLSNAALYGEPMSGGNGKWTEGRYAESAGPSHYRSAAKYIRARLKAAG